MPKLDGNAGKSTEGFTLVEYAEACSKEVDAAVAAWPVVKTATNGAKISCGFAEGGKAGNLSMLWVGGGVFYTPPSSLSLSRRQRSCCKLPLHN